MTVSEAYRILYSGALLVLSVLIGVMLIRTVRGPRITDRILSINMIGTMVISSIAILSVMLGEGYLTDVALIYAMVSFVTVLILTMTYLPEKTRDPMKAAPEKEESADAGRRKKRRSRRKGSVPGTKPEGEKGPGSGDKAGKVRGGTV